MKLNISYHLFITLLFIIFIVYYYHTHTKKHKVYGKVTRTLQESKKGLMFRRMPLKKNEGMLFHKEKNNIHSMWMKNTYIPLDMIFLNKSMKVVGYIEDTEPLSTKSLSINKPSSYVLEMNGNTVSHMNIKIGDTIEFIEVKYNTDIKKI